MMWSAFPLVPQADDELFGGPPTALVRVVADGVRGTGFFIHPRVVVTCAHVVVRSRNGALFGPDSLYVESPAARLWVEWMAVPDEVIVQQSVLPHVDMAALRVRQESLGGAPVAALGPLPAGNRATVWRLGGAQQDVTFTREVSNLAFTPAANWHGSSGAPLVAPPGPLETSPVIAMHRMFSSSGNLGKAVPLTREDTAKMLLVLGF